MLPLIAFALKLINSMNGNGDLSKISDITTKLAIKVAKKTCVDDGLNYDNLTILNNKLYAH